MNNVNARKIRRVFAWLAVAIVVVAVGFYSYARWKFSSEITRLGKKLDVSIEQATQGFTLTKSESGRTLYLVHANSVEKHTGGNALLHSVNIIIYNEDGTGADQIYGDDFEYDAASQIVKAAGVVHMDLEGKSDAPLKPGEIPQELKNPVHLKTSALIFDQKTGLAETANRIEFHTPQSNGFANGALYDSKSQKLTLRTNVHIQLAGENPTNVVADHAELSESERQAVLQAVKMDRRGGALSADLLTLKFAADNHLTGGVAERNVRVQQGSLTILGPRLEFQNGAQGDLSAAAMTNGVQLQDSAGGHGSAGRADLAFGANGRAERVRASGDVRFLQPGKQPNSQAIQLFSDALDIFVDDSGKPTHALTGGAARLVLAQPSIVRITTLTADAFEWRFDGQGQLASLRSRGNSRSVTTEPNRPDAVSTSDVASARLDRGALASLTQQGNFKFTQGARTAQAQQAIYDSARQAVALSGSPRVMDADITTTADVIRFDQTSGVATADGNVKSTIVRRSGSASPAAGGLFAGNDPMHITARHMTADNRTKSARYSGAVRMWQGTSIVEAPVLDLVQDPQSAVASSGNDASAAAVKTSFVELNATGPATPVNVTSTRLRYDGRQRIAHFEGRTILRSPERTLEADRADVYLTAPATSGSGTAGRMDKIVAAGSVRLQEPGRSGQGEHMVYTAAEQKSVLTGTESNPASIFDAEHGKVTGASLTFFFHDDRVLVSSVSNSRSTTTTRINSAPK